MKNEQQEQAKKLFFETLLTKTEIAEQVGVNRRTIMMWCQQGNWDRLRLSARHMPALVAEKCYYVIDQYTTQILTTGANVVSKAHLHADAINKLASAIKKLKNRSTINESMEMFNFFLEGLRRRDEALADQVMPHMEYYMEHRRGIDNTDFLLEEFGPDGLINYTGKEAQENLQDKLDDLALDAELRKATTLDEAYEKWLNPTPDEPTTPPTNTNTNTNPFPHNPN